MGEELGRPSGSWGQREGGLGQQGTARTAGRTHGPARPRLRLWTPHEPSAATLLSPPAARLRGTERAGAQRRGPSRLPTDGAPSCPPAGDIPVPTGWLLTHTPSFREVACSGDVPGTRSPN